MAEDACNGAMGARYSARCSPHLLGAWAEDWAARWYQEHGYRILARNWSCATGEIDIVAIRGALVVFCEVKARSSLRFGAPAEAVGLAKQARLRRLAAAWFAQSTCHAHPGRSPRPRFDCRFDVACVAGGQLDVLQGAF
ncbi:MAG TPA: YraN family protein [Acidimicrobiales bacterium]|nr:YraN family protein [Acidimicrobiales bacterium]